jgi:hypothetical protein
MPLRDESDNLVNPQAILLGAQGQGEVGWVPDWLMDDVHGMRETASLALTVGKVNLDAPPHLRLLCWIEARSG